MIDGNQKYLIALSHFQKFGPTRLKRLKNFFANFEKTFKANLDDLRKAGIEESVAQEFISTRDDIDIDSILEKIKKENIKICTGEDKTYPKLLKEIYDPPQILYYKGELNNNDEFSLAVVGTRKFTSYGKQATEEIVRKLTNNKIVIVSGLALGIDTLAHDTTLGMSGRTIAVLGTGIDSQSIYPSANRYLAEKIIASGGAVISEFPLGTQPLRYNFPQRNRIISGLTLGTLVVEAGEKSGALITAQCALEQNREVFTIPGSIYSGASKGTNNLVKQGARAVTNIEDILETLDLKNITSYIDNKKIIADSPEEKVVIANLDNEPKHVDELIRLTKLNASIINSTLTMMEMKGMVKNLGGMQYVLAR